MRLRIKFGLVGTLALTIYAAVYAVVEGDGTPFGLVVLVAVCVVSGVAGTFLTSWLIDKRWPDLGKRK